MSHHYSGPDFGFPRGDARLDLTDLYAFPKPGRGQVDPGHGRAPVRRQEAAGAHHYGALRARGHLRAEGWTRTAMPSPISPTACSSRRPKVEHRPQHCAALRTGRPPGQATAGKPSLRGRRSRRRARGVIAQEVRQQLLSAGERYFEFTDSSKQLARARKALGLKENEALLVFTDGEKEFAVATDVH